MQAICNVSYTQFGIILQAKQGSHSKPRECERTSWEWLTGLRLDWPWQLGCTRSPVALNSLWPDKDFLLQPEALKTTGWHELYSQGVIVCSP